MDAAKKYLLSMLLIAIAMSGHGEQFEYSCEVKGDVFFTSFDFSYVRPSKWPGNWCTEQPVITSELNLIITGYGKIKSTITATAEGPPYYCNNLHMEAKTPTQGILTFSLLEDGGSNSAWGFGKYKILRSGQYVDHNIFIICER